MIRGFETLPTTSVSVIVIPVYNPELNVENVIVLSPCIALVDVIV